MTAKAPAKGHTAKHVTAKKHAAPKKHAPVKAKKPATAHAKGAKVHVAAKGAKPAKPAGFAIGDLLPVCVSEALAMSLRLAGGAVSDEDVLRLHVLAAGSETAPASIPAALEAASAFGLAGVHPHFADEGGGITSPALPGGHLPVPYFTLDSRPVSQVDQLDRPRMTTPSFRILRVDYPGSHAVLATPDGWWSWGALYSPWDARVEEAWEVSWG